MKLFPANLLRQLEFDKIQELLAAKCRTELSKNKALSLRLHTRKDFIEASLAQTEEYVGLLQAGVVFPSDFVLNIQKELKLLGIAGATLAADQFIAIRKLCLNTNNIFRWFTTEIREQYPALAGMLKEVYYEKEIMASIDVVIDEAGQVRDNASPELQDIRMKLYRKRNEQRRIFDRMVARFNKLGYLTDIGESYMNGRRVLAVFTEQKRQIKGILHSESDSRRTSYIEPEETMYINNEVYTLEAEEVAEVNRILKQLTAKLSPYAPLLMQWFTLAGEFDLVRAKAVFAIDLGATRPALADKSLIDLDDAYHPLLKLYNRSQGKPTTPVNLSLSPEQSIMVISGPNAGGKTVTMKTVGLLQVMLQAGLLVPVASTSTMGIFKQLMIHIGDDQSLEFELSTYSSHLKNMKYFIEHANGRTLFFIDELGGGSDPNLGGAFAEVIMEEMAFKHAFGIITTHYLNLKLMAGKVKGIVNAAMQFDEQKLQPLYKLQIGKPGSSYTFSIAERIGLDKKLINKAKKLVDESQYKLDKLLNHTEQDRQFLDREKEQLQKLQKENDALKKKYDHLIAAEQHKQDVEKQKEQNKINAEKLAYLKDMERKLKAMIAEWRKAEDKTGPIKMMQALLYNQNTVTQERQKKQDKQDKFKEVTDAVNIGDLARPKNTRQVGRVIAIKGKKATLQIGVLPMTIMLDNLVKVEAKVTSQN